MQTKLSRICDAIIEAGWLAALIVTPLFFNTYSNRVFEPDKLHLLRSIALLMSAAWIAQLVDQGIRWRRSESERSPWQAIRQTPLVLPAIVLVLAYLLSSALSIVPRISVIGSYVRLQGTFSFLSYVVIFAMTLTHLRSKSQVSRIVFAIILTSLPVSLYGIVQKAGLDSLPWGGDVQERVAANLGNAIFVAAYLIIAVFFTLERLVDSTAALLSTRRGSLADAVRAGCYVFILAVQLTCIVFSQSRGPWIGLAAGLYIFLLLGVLMLGRWAAGQPGSPRWISAAVKPVWAVLITLTLAGIAFVIVMNIPQGPLAALRDKPYLGRVATMLNTEEGTNAVRALIWEGVVEMVFEPHEAIAHPGTQAGSMIPDGLNALRPLIGYGPESMWVAFNRFYPPDLAHYESRNASPDRSHNETFDTLVQTGIIGFCVQIWLFCSVFYFSLRWLGLMRSPGHRNLFLGLLGGGALAGVVLPWLADHSLRLAGITLPAGIIAGMIVYVTINVLASPAPGSRTGDAGAESASLPDARRQLMILAILAAIVAHFIEIHFGIAIAATRTHFWILAAMLVAIGKGWIQDDESPVLAPAPQSALPAATSSKKKPKGKRTESRIESARTAIVQQPRSPGRKVSYLPYAAIGAIITLVLTWDYLVNQTGAKTAISVLWNAFTQRVDNTSYQVVKSPMLLFVVLFTWLLGVMISLSEHKVQQSGEGRHPWTANALLYLGASLLIFLVYGLIQATRLLRSDLAGINFFRFLAGHVAFFDVVLLLLGLALAAALWAADRRARPQHGFRAPAALSIGAGAIATLLAFLVIIDVNIETVQADTYYKQGSSYEATQSWQSAVIMYREAAELEPQEDNYYLYLGRGLLQYATTLPTSSTPILPADLSAVPTDQLLDLVDRALRANNREDVMRASYAALIAAQRLNPYNTDHSSNLARLDRSWAFADALTASDVPTNTRLREIALTQPDVVHLDRLQQSLAYYSQATSLSPHNAQLWNEFAAVQFITGDSAAAFASLDRSQQLDPLYAQTYVLRGDFLAADNDKTNAVAAYEEAARLQPKNVEILSAVGVYNAQLGNTESALQAFNQTVEIENSVLGAAETKLAVLEAQADAAGGFTMLIPSASSRRAQLQSELAQAKSQLYLTYRNKALVLLEANRLGEALEAAQASLSMATQEQSATVEQLITDIQGRLGK